MNKSFKRAFFELADERVESATQIVSYEDPEFRKASEESKKVMEQLSSELGEKVELLHRLEEIITDISIISNRAIYKQGLRDGIQLAK